MGSLERDTLHRLLTEAARYWVIGCYLERGHLPTEATFYAYPTGPVSFDWGGESTLMGKKVRITLEVEDQP